MMRTHRLTRGEPLYFLLVSLSACVGGEDRDPGDSSVSEDSDSPHDSVRDTALDDPDRDGDGYLSISAGGDDCNDVDPSVHPGAKEVCDDVLDNDCDGAALGCRLEGVFDAGSADAVFSGGEGLLAGYSVSGVGDTNGDGHADVLVGAPGWGGPDSSGSIGAAFLLEGPLGASLEPTSASAWLTGWASNQLVGQDVAGAGDLNDDGMQDMIVTAGNNSRTEPSAWVVFGPVSGEVSLEGADVSLMPPTWRCGISVRAHPDLDDDAQIDLVVGVAQDSTGAQEGGAVYLLAGPFSGLTDVASAETMLYDTVEAAHAGESLEVVGDTDGDGSDDMIVAARQEGLEMEPDVVEPYGAAYLVSGGMGSGQLDLASAAATRILGEAGDSVGTDLGAPGDVDGDGYADVLVGSYHGAGLFRGPLPVGALTFSSRNVAFEDMSDSTFGLTLAGAGDMDADGHPDVLIADLNEGAGRVALYYGPLTGALSSSDADATFDGSAMWMGLGWSLASAGDTNGDGKSDIILGAPNPWGHASIDGSAYLFVGHGF